MVVHARNPARAASVPDLVARAAGVVVGDLSSGAETRAVAAQAEAHGPFDAVIHNAGVYAERSRGSTPEGHATMVAVNVLASYLLTALAGPAARLIYITSGYWYHRQRQAPASAAADPTFQEAMLAELARLTGVTLDGATA